MGSLEVQVISAVNVPSADRFSGKSDPYVRVELLGQHKSTEVHKSELNPIWNQRLHFPLGDVTLASKTTLLIHLKDWERFGRNVLLGQCCLSLKSFVSGDPLQKLTINLKDQNEQETPCQLNVEIAYVEPPSAAKNRSPQGRVIDKTDDDASDEEDEDNEEVVESGRKKKKHRTGQVASKRARDALAEKSMDFQIRVKIVEARQLPGVNISPVARVNCSKQVKQTKILNCTSTPYWNEVFFFNFFCAPGDLFDEQITFGIYYSRQLRSDALIGNFKCDIGLIYDEPHHAFINKWLLLTDPDDHMSGAKGYLKMCACVLGPGDEAPSFKTDSSDDTEDIESNLLRPSGVNLRPATFKLKLFRAEDIPRMDSNIMEGVKKIFGSKEKKELVDPYFVFTFAGKEVRSKIIYNCDHPEFNQELNLPVRFPSMCERIKLQLFDWDQVGYDDCIGSLFLNMNEIAASGDTADEGFLPSFGPSYVNFYGSTREYSDLPDQHNDLNMGKGEGVAYRGRVLLELSTTMGEFPEEELEDISNDDLLKVQKFQRRRKYKLHCAFMNATMVSAIDAPVEFEISIGNYGNKLDESVPPCSSTTQPTNAVFDGCYYYFLPWGDNKPCCQVDSHWEDISFRLEALNFINYIIDRLEKNLADVEVTVQAELEPAEQAQVVIALLDQLIENCQQPLPKVYEGRHIQNELDRQLRDYRESELQHISKHAEKLREEAKSVENALNEIQNYLGILRNCAVEPQNSMPDIILWMISGSKRIAYYRCPANLVLWSENEMYRGKFCGKMETIVLKYPGNIVEDENKWDIPALVRVKIWLGLEKHESNWHEMQTEGCLAVFAETYENQVSVLGSWTNKGPTMSRPKFSDASGKIALDKNDFTPPPGWKWEEDWYVSPELSMLFDKDAGHTSFLEDVYEFQTRIPGGSWNETDRNTGWTNVKGDVTVARDDVVLPDDWEWVSEWEPDLNRAVDEEGWEYTVEATIGGYGPVQKNYHMCRRRRWVRTRSLLKNAKMKEQEELMETEAKSGWEYAPLFTMKYHHRERKMDMVRRRRWHRKMVASDKKAPCFFKIPAEDSGEDKHRAALTAPRMFLTCDKPKLYQLRVYLFQARGLLAGDSNGLSDPFARVAFVNKSRISEKLDKTVCPTWDQTLIFDSIEIHGVAESLILKPPEIILEIFDHDTFGGAEFLGRTKAYPLVKLEPNDPKVAILQWYPITKGNQDGGELLSAFELFSTENGELPFEPPKRGNLLSVPQGIRPQMRRTAIEIMCWGVRNMKKFQLSSVNSPHVEFEIGGTIIKTKPIKSAKKNPNFSESNLFTEVYLPVEELYMPPMNIRVIDNRQFGRKPLVGVVALKSLKDFKTEPLYSDETDLNALGYIGRDRTNDDITIEMGGEKTPMLSDTDSLQFQGKYRRKPATIWHSELWEEDIDWWSKYYCSIGEMDKCKFYLECGYDKIQVYNKQLEDVEPHNGFNDFCATFVLERGKSLDEEESNKIGEFKGSFCVYELPEDPSQPLPLRQLENLPSSEPEEIVIRVYIVKAIDLQPNDPSGLYGKRGADPFVEIQLGKKAMNSRDEYRPNTLNPVFGRMFEMKAMMSLDKDLVVRVIDYDMIGSDDLIGETTIDLENRFLTKYRAVCGLPASYCLTGPCAWRDCQTPKEILEGFCLKHRLSTPVYESDESVKVGNRMFNLSDYESGKPKHTHLGPPQERLALHILNSLPKSMKLPLTNEHVETRRLYNPLQPAIEQGKIQMWVDLFPSAIGPPGPPVNISARKPKKYELRMVIWNTTDVIMEEESITGEMMTDIYVKGWIQGIDEEQETDVHYRSMDGDGNFNWRFVFPFEYVPAEDCMVVKKKEHFWSLDVTELHLPPILTCQIWDNDKFSGDDFIGTLDLNLNKMPAPVKKSKSCSLSQLPDLSGNKTQKNKMVSLFEQKRMKGFWPCYRDLEGSTTGERELVGKIEMEMELVSSEDAEKVPVGLGREEPNTAPLLASPNRPETSFLWIASPWKTLKHIIWKQYKWWFLSVLLILLVIIFFALFIYAVPGVSVRKLFGV